MSMKKVKQDLLFPVKRISFEDQSFPSLLLHLKGK